MISILHHMHAQNATIPTMDGWMDGRMDIRMHGGMDACKHVPYRTNYLHVRNLRGLSDPHAGLMPASSPRLIGPRYVYIWNRCLELNSHLLLSSVSQRVQCVASPPLGTA